MASANALYNAIKDQMSLTTIELNQIREIAKSLNAEKNEARETKKIAKLQETGKNEELAKILAKKKRTVKEKVEKPKKIARDFELPQTSYVMDEEHNCQGVIYADGLWKQCHAILKDTPDNQLCKSCTKFSKDNGTIVDRIIDLYAYTNKLGKKPQQVWVSYVKKINKRRTQADKPKISQLEINEAMEEFSHLLSFRNVDQGSIDTYLSEMQDIMDQKAPERKKKSTKTVSSTEPIVMLDNEQDEENAEEEADDTTVMTAKNATEEDDEELPDFEDGDELDEEEEEEEEEEEAPAPEPVKKEKGKGKGKGNK